MSKDGLLEEMEKHTWPCSEIKINKTVVKAVKKNAAKDLLNILEIAYRNKARRAKPFSLHAIHVTTAV